MLLLCNKGCQDCAEALEQPTVFLDTIDRKQTASQLLWMLLVLKTSLSLGSALDGVEEVLLCFES